MHAISNSGVYLLLEDTSYKRLIDFCDRNGGLGGLIELRMRLVQEFAFILTIIGILMIIFALFQACLAGEELTVSGMALRNDGVAELETFSHNLMWFFSLLTELVGGFFLASIGMKILKR
jgi:hypothetical protein